MKNFLSKLWSLSRADRVRTLAIDAVSLPSFCRVNMLKLVSVLVLILTVGVGNVWGALPANPTWTATALADIADDATIIIMSSSNHALPSTTTSSSPAKISCTISTTNGISTITPGSGTLQNLAWTVDKLASSWKFYQEGSATVHLYLSGTGSNTALRVGTGSSNDQFVMGNGGKLLKVTTATRYVGPYSSGSDWRTYNSETHDNYGSASLTFYVLNTGGSTPTITKSSSMTTLTYSNGSPVAQSFTVGGTNLTHNVTVTAPTDYEVCLTENGTYTSSVELSKGSGTLSNTTVYIRLQAGLSAGNISSRNISLESEGATTQTIAVTGSVPYTITWMANGNLHATTYVAVGSTLALPATNPVPNSCGCTGKAFFGWYGLGTSYKHASNAPSIAAAGDAVSADKTYYAVFADAEEGDPVYTKVTSITAGTYVMVSEKTASTYRYMPNTTSSSTNPTLGSGITMSTTAGVTTLTNAVTDAMLWDISTGETSGYFYVRPHGSTTIGLGTTNSTGGNIRISTTYVNTEWRFTTSASYGWEIYNGSMYLAVYADNAWRNYSNNSTNQNGTFYMFKQSGGTTYSNYDTSCCTTLGSINGSISLTQGGNSVTISGWSDVSNVGTYTVKMYKKNGGGTWDLVSGTATGGSAGTAGTRTGITSGSKSVTYTGLEVESEYKFSVQAIAGSSSYCNGDETDVTSINSTDVSSTPFKFRYSIYIDNGSGSGWAHHYIEPTGNTDEGSVSITLGAHVDYYQFKIAGGFSGWWGQSGSSKIPANTQWTLNSDQNVHLETGAGGSYTFTVDYSGTTNPKVTVTFPSADQGSGYKIYFDKSVIADWGSALKYRIGNGSHNQSQDFTLVPGTDNFYVTTTPSYGSMDAWHIANNSGQTGSTSIYYTKGTGAITNSIAFQQSVVTENITIIPTTTHSTGGDDQNNNCQFYTINTPTSGMLTHNVAVGTAAHGTLVATYTNTSGTSGQTVTEGNDADLAHRCIITITATPDDGYTCTSLTVNSSDFTSGNTHILIADIDVAATFTAKTYNISLDREGATTGSENVTMTYNSADHTAITAPTKSGYDFGGWYTEDNGTGTQVMNASGVLQANVTGYTGAGGIWTKTTPTTLYAKWTLKTTTVSFNQNSGTGGQTSNVTATYGQAMPSTPVACPTRAGYTFTGYYENSGGTGTKYYNADGSSATNWNKENATWTLYAGWTAKEDTYKTALHTGASGWTSYASGVTKSGGQYNIPNPGSVAKGATSTCEDTHYHFAGWVTDANKEAGTISGNIIAATGKADATGTTYWAVWEKETSGGATTIELNYSNLSVSTSSYAQSSATVGGVGFTINQGYRGGSNPNYLIQMNSSKGDGTLFNTTAISGLQSIKLYCATAGATATIYQGTSQKPVSTSTPDERVGTAACAASTNYTINFTGSGEYFTLKVGGATYFSKIEVSYCTYEDPKAECEACAATPSITGVSLSGSTFSLTSVPVQATGASAGTNCAISSYGFCWGTSASPTGNSTASANLSAGTFSATLTGPFSVGQTYYYRAFATNEAPNTGYSSDGTFTLRSVTFNLNGHGSSAPSIQYVNNGGKASDPSYSEDVTGWRFVGWYDEAACRDGHEWVFGTNTVSGGNATIYAKWLPDPTITFSVPTGVDAVASQRASVNLPTPTGFPSAVDDDCWAFAGWTESSSVNSTDKPATFYPAGAPYSGSQTSAFTLYAVYSRNKYLVVYDNDMLVADADYIITTWYSDDYAVVGVADGNNAEVADMEDNFHDKVLRGLHYYTLDNPAENAVWHLTGTTDSYVLQNKATGKYLDIAGTSLISESSATLSITEGTGEDRQTYKLTGGDNHLVISSSGASVATGDATYYFLYKLISSKYMTSPAEPTYTVTWKVAGEDDQTSTVSACAGIQASDISALTIPGDDHLEIKNSGCITNTKGKFMGWSTRELGSTSGQGDPGDLFKTYDKAPYLTDDITLYAVFAEAGGGGVPYYGLVEEDEDATEGTYLIVYNGTYAMGSHHDGNNTDTYSDYSDISSYYDDEDKKIASNSTTNALAYIAEKTTNGYSLKHSETISSVATDVYLGCSKNDNKGLRWDYPFTASTDEWVLGAGSINSVGQSSRYIRWNNTSGQYRFSTYQSASCQDIQLYKYNSGVTYSDYRTSCCAKKVTIGTPDQTGSGTVTFASGGDAYAAGDEVTTCEGATTITVTITPTNGHQCTALEFTRSDSEDLTPDPAISVPFTGAQSYDLTFEQNADGVTLNTTVTFVALIDHYIDNMHYNTTQNKSGNYGTAPTLSNETKGEECTGLHYKFIGWIPEADMNMTTGVPTTTANMVAGGATGKYATGTNYYAIWAEEE